MKQENELPETLHEAVKYFADQDVALQFMVNMRWPDGVVKCPRCNSARVNFTAKRRVWTCEDCPKRRQFSIKVGTIMEDSPIGLDKWIVGMWLITSAKNGISSYELHRALGITQKSAWFLGHRIRFALHNGSIEKMSGTVEADESWIGGSARNMHPAKKAKVMKGCQNTALTPVMGLLERGTREKASRIKLQIIRSTKRAELHGNVRKYVLKGAEVQTDALYAYRGLDSDYTHKVVDHAVAYVQNGVHTNGLENFWSLLKRTIKGTYVSVEPFHLFRYLDEQAFRFNERKDSDLERFLKVVQTIAGKRLTYNSLTGITGIN
jgi:transposase-like protein